MQNGARKWVPPFVVSKLLLSPTKEGGGGAIIGVEWQASLQTANAIGLWFFCTSWTAAGFSFHESREMGKVRNRE